MLIAVDGGGYREACSALYDGNHQICATLLTLSSGADDGAAMAGGDTCGQTWAEQYDTAAAQALLAGSDLADAFARLGNLTNASLVNHEAADGGAMLTGGPTHAVDDGDHDPDHWTESVGLGSPPSAFGGTGDTPGWWHWLAGHLEGWFWPDADTGRLRSVGASWTKAADAMKVHESYAESAVSSLQVERSPEIETAAATLRTLKSHAADLSLACADLGTACQQYAQDVEDKHSETEHEVASFLEWTVGIEIGGAILGALTLGAGEGAAQIVEGAEAANAASKVLGVLRSLLELAKAAATAITAILTRIGEIVSGLGRFLTAGREIAAVERAGAEAAEAVASRGAWTQVSEHMSARAAAYQEQITGHAGESYVVDGVKYDGSQTGRCSTPRGRATSASSRTGSSAPGGAVRTAWSRRLSGSSRPLAGHPWCGTSRRARQPRSSRISWQATASPPLRSSSPPRSKEP